jgi:leucyl/phenylalanyl-tRNA--protein transferase
MDPVLTPELVLAGYRAGIFPMADETGAIAWFSPHPRCIFPLEPPQAFRVPRSLRQVIRRGRFAVRINTAFAAVIAACADRPEGTWISDEVGAVYTELHRRGSAHSVEAWCPAPAADPQSDSQSAPHAAASEPESVSHASARDQPEPRAPASDQSAPRAAARDWVLAGGLYGVAIGGAFFGESMFTRITDASKVALVHLVARLRARGFIRLDTQWNTPHLARLGAVEIPRREYQRRLKVAVALDRRFT